jgi:hypothetical protein
MPPPLIRIILEELILAAGQKSTPLLMEPEGTLPYFKRQSLIPILSQINPVHTLRPYFFKIFVNIMLRVIKPKRVRWKNVARMGEVRNAYKILVGKPEGKRSLGRHRRR